MILFDWTAIAIIILLVIGGARFILIKGPIKWLDDLIARIEKWPDRVKRWVQRK